VEPTRVQIGDETYQLRQWSVDDGDRWWFTLGYALAQLLPHVKKKKDGTGYTLALSEAQVFMELAQMLGVEKMLEFGQVCRAYTDLVGRDPQGRETVQPLSQLPLQLRGKQDVLTELMIAHGRAQFSGPLVRAFSRLGAASEPAEKEK
jgi:hypothetical protein